MSEMSEFDAYMREEGRYWSVLYWDGFEEARDQLSAAAHDFVEESDKVEGLPSHMYFGNITRHRAGKGCDPRFQPLCESFARFDELKGFWCGKDLDIDLIRTVTSAIVSRYHPAEMERLERILERDRKTQLALDRKFSRKARSLRAQAKKADPEEAERMRELADQLDAKAYQLPLALKRPKQV